MRGRGLHSKLKKYWLIMLISLGIWPALQAQVTAEIHFVEDAFDIGKPTPLRVDIAHPANTVVIFPDSATGFLPFEVAKTEVHPTQTHEGISTDTKIFHLWSWEIQSIQKLRIRIRYIADGDTLTTFSNTDSIRLNERIPVMDENFELKAIHELSDVDDPPQVLLIILSILLSAFILLVTGYYLYPPLLRLIARWKLKKEWNKLEQLLDELKSGKGGIASDLHQLNLLWKRYLEQALKQNIPAKTTDELEKLFTEGEGLTSEQKQIFLKTSILHDRILFGGETAENLSMKALVLQIREQLYHVFRERLKQAGR